MPPGRSGRGKRTATICRKSNVAAGLCPGRPTGWKPVPHTNVAAGPRTGRPTGWKPVPHTNVAAGPRTGRGNVGT